VIRTAATIVLGLWVTGVATGTTYTYVGPAYTTAQSLYTTAMSVTGTFDTAAPLPANMPSTEIGPDGSGLATAWSFFDGVNTLTQANSFPLSFHVQTDALGNISSYAITLLSPQPPNTVGQAVNSIAVALPAVFGELAFEGGTCGSLINTVEFTDVCASWGGQSARSATGNGFAPNFTALPPTISKSFALGSVPLNGTTSLSFTLTNPNAATSLTGVAFTDSFPAGIVIATPNGLSNTCGGAATALQGTGIVSLTGASIAGNGSCTLTVAVTAIGTGVLANTTAAATSTESLPGDTASATLQVARQHVTAAIPTLGSRPLWLLALLVALVGAGPLRHRRPVRRTSGIGSG